jgi:protein-tyrosine-phosphatase
MAAAFARQIADGRVRVLSAGSDPSETLNPAVVAAMAEVGLDISNESPQVLTNEMALEADVVITMGCGDACPVYPGKRYVDWALSDPAGRDLAFVRGVRDEIRGRVQELLDTLIDGGRPD